MYAAVTLILLVGLTATTHADHHHAPCHPPNITGMMSVMSVHGEMKAMGHFTFDSTGNRLRFRCNDSVISTTTHTDLLMLFEEGVFYEIDSKNQSCEKKAVQSHAHPLQVPKDAKYSTTLTMGNPSIEGEGMKVNVWTGPGAELKDSYIMTVTMGCLPVSVIHFSEPSFIISLMELENEVKDPDLLAVPSYCQGLAVEETVKSFLQEFV